MWKIGLGGRNLVWSLKHSTVQKRHKENPNQVNGDYCIYKELTSILQMFAFSVTYSGPFGFKTVAFISKTVHPLPPRPPEKIFKESN